jgi:hypothetical protein
MLAASGHSMEFGCRFLPNDGPSKAAIPEPLLMEIFTITSWQIWKQRNDTIFDRGRPSFNFWKVLFLEGAKLQAHRFPDEAKRATFLLLCRASCLVLYCFSFGLFRLAFAAWHLARQLCTVFFLPFLIKSQQWGPPLLYLMFKKKERKTVHWFYINEEYKMNIYENI